MKCFRCNFVPFFLQTSLKVGNSTGSSLSHFALQNAPHILYWRQVGTAGRPVKYPYPLPPQPGLCNVCRMWFCIVLLKYAWTSLEKMSSFFFFVINNFFFFFFHTQHNRIFKIKQNKTADTYSTSQGSIKREGEREGQQEHKSHSFK